MFYQDSNKNMVRSGIPEVVTVKIINARGRNRTGTVQSTEGF